MSTAAQTSTGGPEALTVGPAAPVVAAPVVSAASAAATASSRGMGPGAGEGRRGGGWPAEPLLRGAPALCKERRAPKSESKRSEILEFRAHAGGPALQESV